MCNSRSARVHAVVDRLLLPPPPLVVVRTKSQQHQKQEQAVKRSSFHSSLHVCVCVSMRLRRSYAISCLRDLLSYSLVLEGTSSYWYKIRKKNEKTPPTYLSISQLSDFSWKRFTRRSNGCIYGAKSTACWLTFKCLFCSDPIIKVP